MTPKKAESHILSRRQLFDFLQGQMQDSYTSLKETQRLSNESNLIKSYIIEANSTDRFTENPEGWLNSLFGTDGQLHHHVKLIPTEEEAFYQLLINVKNNELRLFIDAATDKRFWLAYSVSESQSLDRWLEALVKRSTEFDFVWLWPRFLERIQEQGHFRGFGLDYDFRKFEMGDAETTTYLKMQLWGGENTQNIYRILQNDPDFSSKVVLSKVRFKQLGENSDDSNIFAIQDAKYNGKFTARGTDLSTHLLTLNGVRSQYKEQVLEIEDKCAIRWVENDYGGISVEGFAIHFLPKDFKIPASLMADKLFDGTEPFRLMGFPNVVDEYFVVMDVVDLHTGGKLSIEIHPDVMTIYLPEKTCGNSIARLYTNIQHTFNVGFEVETDDGAKLFN